MSITKVYDCYLCEPHHIDFICDRCGKSLKHNETLFTTEKEIRTFAQASGWYTVETDKGPRDFCLECYLKYAEKKGELKC